MARVPKNPTDRRWQGCLVTTIGVIVLLTAAAPNLIPSEHKMLATVGIAVASLGIATYLSGLRQDKSGARVSIEPTAEMWPVTSEPLATISTPSSIAEQLFVESVLRNFDIPFVTQTQHSQNLVGGGQWGGPNIALGPPEIQVAAKDAERAERLLREAPRRTTEGTTIPAEIPQAASAETSVSPTSRWPNLGIWSLVVFTAICSAVFIFAPQLIKWLLATMLIIFVGQVLYGVYLLISKTGTRHS
jgi:hypothetical protein